LQFESTARFRAAMLIVTVPMSKQMQQRAGQEQQVRSGGQDMARVGPKQVRTECRDSEHHDQTGLRADKATESRHARFLGLDTTQLQTRADQKSQ
jgi:hypothetical protein